MAVPLATTGTTTALATSTGPAGGSSLDLAPGQQPPKLNIQADLHKEYVSGGAYSFLLSGYYRALPQYIDDVTADFGDDLYDRMMLDPQVASAINTIRLGALSNGLTLSNPISDKEDPQYQPAQDILDFCNRNIKRLDEPLTQTLFAMLEGIATGNKLAEKLYETPATGPDKGKLCLKAVKVKPRRTTAFVIDGYNNVGGILALMPGQAAATILTQGLIGLPSAATASPDTTGERMTPANLLPREKFAVFAFRPQDGDPRGTSILRAAYTPWWNKIMTEGEYLKYLAQFASPSIIGKTAEGANAVPVSDSYGNPTPTNGVQLYQTPEEILNTALLAFRNSTVLTVPFGTEIDALEVQGDGTAFITAFNRFDSEITRAITSQTLATNEAVNTGQIATAAIHENILDMVIQQAKDALAAMVVSDLLRPIVLENFGEDAADSLTPEATFADQGKQDFAQNAAAIAQLMSAGYLHESQFAGIDADLGLPPRNQDQIAQEKAQAAQDAADAKQAQLDALAKQPQPAAQPGQQPGQQQPGQDPNAPAVAADANAQQPASQEKGQPANASK